MECPYCKKEMQLGAIPAVRQAVRWEPEGDIGEVVQLTAIPLVSQQRAMAYCCPNCRIILMPMPEKIEGTMENLKEKWKQLRGDADEKYTDYKTVQEKDRYRKMKAKQRKKDPWEV